VGAVLVHDECHSPTLVQATGFEGSGEALRLIHGAGARSARWEPTTPNVHLRIYAKLRTNAGLYVTASDLQFGLVAEDVEKINPDLVVRDREGNPFSVIHDQVNAMLLNEE
jgi:hypothetical protein